MQPIKIKITKLFYEPSPLPYKYNYSMPRRCVGEIDYENSIRFFNQIKTDVQLARTLLENYGTGEFILKVWKKHHKGFWMFIRLFCFDNYFIRLEQKENIDSEKFIDQRREYNKLLNKKLDSDDSDEKDEIERQLRWLSDVIKENKNNSLGCSSWIKVLSKEGIPTSYEIIESKTMEIEQTANENLIDEAFRIW